MKVDVDTPAFDGGVEMNLRKLNGTLNEIPITTKFEGGGDFYSQTFTYGLMNDTVFHASVVWMGTGKIIYPGTFAPPKSFLTIAYNSPMPDSVHIFQGSPYSNDQIKATFPNIWSRISNLAIVKTYLDHNAMIGLYLYPPTIGMYDPGSAKWIFFIYVQ